MHQLDLPHEDISVHVAELISELGRTLFLAKFLDEFANFLTPGQDYSVIAARCSEHYLQPYSSIFVYEQVIKHRSFSTSGFFRTDLFRYGSLLEELKGSKNICTFQPYPWTDDLACLGVDFIGNPFHLYLLFSNKLTFPIMLERSGLEILQVNINARKRHFKTSFLTPYETPVKHDTDVGYVYARRNSDGGSGVISVKDAVPPSTIFHKASEPIYRCECYLEGLIPVTQTAAVFSNETINLPMGIQIIVPSSEGNLAYLGTDYNIDDHLSQQSRNHVNALTNAVGRMMASHGYRGVMGCDYLIDPHSGFAYLEEINPRFQASTFLFSGLANADLDAANPISILANPYLLHLAGFKYTRPHKALLDAVKMSGCSHLLEDQITHTAIVRLKQDVKFVASSSCPDYLELAPTKDVTVDSTAPYRTMLFKGAIVKKASTPQKLNFSLTAFLGEDS